MYKLYLIGCGPGDESLFTERAKSLINRARKVLYTRETPLTEIISILKDKCIDEIAVLVSGDSGFYSISKTICDEFSDTYDIEQVPGISSIQYMSSKLKIPYDDAKLLSLHGREGSIVPKVTYNRKVFVLTGGSNGVHRVIDDLCNHGLDDVFIHIGEKLSYPQERIINGRAYELIDMQFDTMSVMYIENMSAVSPHAPLFDNDFIRADVPMTKEEIRSLAVQKLRISPNDVVYDIGAGTGSVSIELARKAFESFVYAIEKNDAACRLISENASVHCAHNLEIINGTAPDALHGLPIANKAFIGGSMGSMKSIIRHLFTTNPKITVVTTAITIQTLNDAIEGFHECGVSTPDVICVNIAKLKTLGNSDMMIAQNPIYIISGTGGLNK